MNIRETLQPGKVNCVGYCICSLLGVTEQFINTGPYEKFLSVFFAEVDPNCAQAIGLVAQRKVEDLVHVGIINRVGNSIVVDDRPGNGRAVRYNEPLSTFLNYCCTSSNPNTRLVYLSLKVDVCETDIFRFHYC